MIHISNPDSNMDTTTVVRTPDTSNTLVDTLNWLGNPLQLLSARIAQQLCLLQHLFLLQVSHADCLLAAVDVVADYYWVFSWSRGNGHFDLGIRGCELGEGVAEKGAVEVLEGCYVVYEIETYFMPFELPAQSQ